ncbi:hypothetical protein BDR05DRAFT_950288 [Suillus weaverae]|nr:hypothetical protein BDR05DRAFT_950288 [Suillus weaverae]
MTPRVWPNWHSIGHDDPQVLKHAWRNKVHTWEALGDNSCDLHVVPNPSTGPLTVDLPSPPILPSAPVLPSPPIIVGSSSQTMSKLRDKGKGKEVAVDLEPEVEGSRKRKSPMISGHSSQPPKSAMKGRKCVTSTQPVKLKLIVELEDDEETIVQPISRGVLEGVLPPLSTILVRQPQLPCSPGFPKKQSFWPASLTAGSGLEVPKTPISRPEVMATSNSHPEVVQPDGVSSVSDGGPPAIPTFNVTIPGPIPQNNPCHFCVKEEWPYTTRLDKRTSQPSVLSASYAVPRAALNVPILDLHSMTITIQDAAARIAVLEARVWEQDVMEPTNLKVEDQSAMVGLVFEPSKVQPEGPQSSGENVVLDDRVNLLPEYNSVDEEMDVEVKDEPSGEEVKMVT